MPECLSFVVRQIAHVAPTTDRRDVRQFTTSSLEHRTAWNPTRGTSYLILPPFVGRKTSTFQNISSSDSQTTGNIPQHDISSVLHGPQSPGRGTLHVAPLLLDVSLCFARAPSPRDLSRCTITIHAITTTTPTSTTRRR